MLPHWEEVQESFRVLAYIAKSFGDEIELRFTSSTECWKNKKTTLLLDLIRNKKPAGLSDMKEPFDQILDGYRTRQQDNDDRPKNRFWPAKSPRRLSLYVFTNGTWEDNIGVEKPIENMVKFLEERSKTARTVGIQFIRFGDDPEGIKRLNHLDRLPLSMYVCLRKALESYYLSNTNNPVLRTGTLSTQNRQMETCGKLYSALSINTSTMTQWDITWQINRRRANQRAKICFMMELFAWIILERRFRYDSFACRCITGTRLYETMIDDQDQSGMRKTSGAMTSFYTFTSARLA